MKTRNQELSIMDIQPKTRREIKKDQKQKADGKNGKYSQKHVREVEKLKEKKK